MLDPSIQVIPTEYDHNRIDELDELYVDLHKMEINV